MPTRKQINLKNEKGQSFVEFMLLLLVMISLSFIYLKIVNTNVSKIWTLMVNTVIQDTNPDGEVRIK